MNRSSIVALVIGAMLFGCGVGMVTHEVMEPEVAEAYEGQKWEYHLELSQSGMGQAFIQKQIERNNELGQSGWELVQRKDETWIFKRPLN